MTTLFRQSAKLRALILLIACSPLLGLSSFEALFAPKADPWPRWKSHVADSKVQANHDPWDRILERHVRTGTDGINRFDYTRLKREGIDGLEDYLMQLAAVPVSRMDRDAQMAFWINLYNALTVHTVATAYPVKSIRDIDISPGLFADGPWDKPLIEVEGTALTLNDIEHRILRPLWRDPRIHYALNCASLGCPNLAPSAYKPKTLDTMLDKAARGFVNSPRGVRWKEEQPAVSSIYAWFKEDFGGDDAGILSHLRRFAEPDLGDRLVSVRHIRKHDYDWRLNDLNR